MTMGRRPQLCLGNCLSLLLLATTMVAAEVIRSEDGRCEVYKYIMGFSLSFVTSNRYPLAGALCRGLSKPHVEQPTQCISVDREVYRLEHWNQCPPGFFLQSNENFKMRCCKPSGQPNTIFGCQDQNVQLNVQFTVECPKSLIVARTRDVTCGNNEVCTTAISCCKMSDEPPSVLNLDDLKIRVMDDTQVPLSLLAHFLGYGWCGGCEGRYVGESMKATSEGWSSDLSGECSGMKSKDRLSIKYGDWKLIPGEPVYSDVEHTNLKPAIILTGVLTNNDTHSNTFTVGQEILKSHLIFHSTLTSFTLSHDVGFQVSYKSSFLGGAEFATTYNFGYESTEEEVHSTEEGESTTLRYSSEVTLRPCTSVEYRIVLASSKATQYYNVTMQTSYSAEFDGFLRYGGGRDGKYTNFHKEYRGSSDRPEYRSKFGDSETSIHDDIGKQSRYGTGHWEWKNMQDRHPSAQTLIKILSDHSRHEFNLTGKFEEVTGQAANIVFQWRPPPVGCPKPPPETEEDSRTARSVRSNDLNISDDTILATTTTAKPTFLDLLNSTFLTSDVPGTIKQTTSTSIVPPTTLSLTSTSPGGAYSTNKTEPVELKFDSVYVRKINLNTGHFEDVADDPEVIDDVEDPVTTPTEEEKLVYMWADGTRNPHFDFGKYFVTLNDDNLMSTGYTLNPDMTFCILVVTLTCSFVVF